MKGLAGMALCSLIIGCTARTGDSSAQSTGSLPRQAAATPHAAVESDWLPFRSTHEEVPLAVEPRPSESSEGHTHRGARVYGGRRDVVASAITDIACQQLDECCSDLPELDDLRLVFQTSVQSVAAPEFENYNALMLDRGCILLSSVEAVCRDLWKFVDFGFSEEEWAGLTLTEKARAYWNAVDGRKARWMSASPSSVRVGTDLRTIPRRGSGQIMSLSFFRPPGGFGAFYGETARVAFVHVELHVERGVAPVTFCYAFDSESRKWYPFWTMNHYTDRGPACVIKF